MNENDRHIVTFGGEDETGGVSENNGFTASSDFSFDLEVPQDVTPVVESYPYIYEEDKHVEDVYAGSAETAETADDAAISAAENVEAAESSEIAETADQIREENPSGYVSDDFQPKGPSYDDHYSPKYMEPAYTAPARQAKERKYVTKGGLALCMILTMIVSSLLGGFIGANVGRSDSKDSTPQEVSEEAPEQNDSDLSQISLSDATDSPLTIAEIVAMNENAVVEILVSGTTQNYFGQMQVTEGAGSGVIINEKGYIVTNYHVIQGANKVQVTLHNGETYPATIIGGVNESDIAVIKINPTSDLTIARIGDSDTVRVGDTAVAIGNPLGQLGGTATTGIISALDRNLTIDGRTLKLMQTDAAINGGNSGGGLFNSKGELIGIVDAKSSGVGIEGLAFAIPINAVIGTINDLVENGKISAKPAIGIMIQDVSAENAQYYNLEAAGVYIAQVTGDNAKRAGFQQGDRIISIDGFEVQNSKDLITKVREHKAGDTVSVIVSRSGQQIEIKTVLEEMTTN